MLKMFTSHKRVGPALRRVVRKASYGNVSRVTAATAWLYLLRTTVSCPSPLSSKRLCEITALYVRLDTACGSRGEGGIVSNTTFAHILKP